MCKRIKASGFCSSRSLLRGCVFGTIKRGCCNIFCVDAIRLGHGFCTSLRVHEHVVHEVLRYWAGVARVFPKLLGLVFRYPILVFDNFVLFIGISVLKQVSALSIRAPKHVHGFITCQPCRSWLSAIHSLVGFSQLIGVKGGLVVFDGGKVAVLGCFVLRQADQLHVLKLSGLTPKNVTGDLLRFRLCGVLFVCKLGWSHLAAKQ